MPYTTSSSQHRIHYFDSKPSKDSGDSKLVIVMIHGLGSSQNYWMPVISHLSTFRCIALDTYGAGRSKSQGEPLSIEGMAADVIDLMDALDVQEAVIAGHSMGGTMACLIAAKYPERVLGVVPVGPGKIANNNSRTLRFTYAKAVNPSSVKPEIFTARIQTVLNQGMEPLADTVPTAATSSQSTPLARAFVRELIINSDAKAYASHCQVIVDAVDPDYRAIKAPVCIIAGKEDKSAPLEGCEYIHQRIGSSQKSIDVLDDCGHWHCVETPERISSTIDGFCRDVKIV